MLSRFVGVASIMLMLTVPILGAPSDVLALLFGGFRSGGVFCDETAVVGSVKKEPKALTCKIGPLPGGDTSINGLVLCGNPGVKIQKAPGINVADFEGTFDTFEPIDPSNCDKNGKCKQTLHATLTSEQLTSLNEACPAGQNTNWVALDFVPCSMSGKIEIVGLDCAGNEVTLEEAIYSCTLPNCHTLQYDKSTQTMESRAYNCTVVSNTKFQAC